MIRPQLACVSFLVASAIQAQSLPFATDIQVSLPAIPAGQAAVNTSLFVDVPPGTTSIKFELDWADRNRDIDLLVARAAFPTASSVNDFFDASSYYSARNGGPEELVVSVAQEPPLSASGRWHIALVALEGSETNGTLRVTASTDALRQGRFEAVYSDTVDSDCVAGAWDDPTPIMARGGNPATTLGAARRNAVARAVELLNSQVHSPTPIRIETCFANLGNQNVIAQAGPRRLFRDAPGLARAGTWYASGVVATRAGTAICGLGVDTPCDTPEIQIQFNTNFSNFYFGYDAGFVPGTIDIITVALHEIGHGLGFLSLINRDTESAEVGTELGGRDDIFSYNLVDFRTGKPGRRLSDDSFTAAERVTVMTSSAVSWFGFEANLHPQNITALLLNDYIPIHAPATLSSGSSISHQDPVLCTLLQPSYVPCGLENFRDLGLTKPMLNAVGWASGDKRPQAGLWFDRTRSGTGFDFHPQAVRADGTVLYAVAFYSFKDDNTPEWFLAQGEFQEGTFAGTPFDPVGGMLRYTYDANRTPRSQPDLASRAQLIIDFNDPLEDSACEGARAGAIQLAVARWTVGNAERKWCIEPLAGRSNQPLFNYTGLYYGGEADSGWGLGLHLTDVAGGQVVVSAALYFFDGAGQPRWVFGQAQTANVGADFTIPMFKVQGFCRTCTPTAQVGTPAGSITMRLADYRQGPGTANRVTLAITYPEAPGGTWNRNQVPLELFSLPFRSF